MSRSAAVCRDQPRAWFRGSPQITIVTKIAIAAISNVAAVNRPNATVCSLGHPGFVTLTVDDLPVAPGQPGQRRHRNHTDNAEPRDMTEERRARDQYTARGHRQRRPCPRQGGALARQARIVGIQRRPRQATSRPSSLGIQCANRSTTARIPPNTAITAIPPVSRRGIHE